MKQLLLILAGLVACGCSQHIVVHDTRGYNVRVATLPIPPDTAAAIYKAAADLPEESAFPQDPIRPDALWDRWYVFGTKPYKAKLVLDGYFVNGDTGHVEKRMTGKVIEGQLLGYGK